MAVFCRRGRAKKAKESWRFMQVVCAVSSIFCGLAGPPAAVAIDWKRMVMPGPLAASHAKFEKDCGSCHQAFEGGAQRALCLACHEEVADDLEREVGFHSRSDLAGTGQCRNCHPDHLGRDADISGLSEATFDHALTDYPLRGRHAAVSCGGCHPADKSRRETPTACIDCHREDDAHDGALSQDCAECHDEIAWRKTRFDHDKTKYPLTGAHQKADCNGCHVAARYKGTPQDCVSCHAIDDAHAGRFGTDCAECHKTDAWRRKGFDHEKKSGFALRGAHGKAACTTCHRKPPGKRKLPETCSGCHASDDVHSGRFGEKCSTCHAPTTWQKTSFDHAKDTKFPLRGAHARGDCTSCHAGPVEKGGMKMDCLSCHRSDDVHRGDLGKDCAECHNEDSFSGRIRFDHELTGFPLLGLHAVAACESCHEDHRFKREETSCRACHRQDDVHERTLGDDCERCHNPNGWNRWRFDHDRQTTFALHGAHEDLGCSGCHRTRMTKRTQVASDCIDCHVKQDVHRGGFGRSCGNCHSDEAWKPATFGRSAKKAGAKKAGTKKLGN